MLKALTRLALFSAVFAVGVQAQVAAATQGGGAPPLYSLDLQSRLVVEDVSVLDLHSKPVTGLPASAFHVYDNGKLQTLRNFQKPPDSAVAGEGEFATGQLNPRGTFSNAGLLQNHGTVIVLLIDPLTMLVEDQMYLRLQALKFIDQAPASASMCVFRVNSSGVPVMLQPLTSDKAQLRVAVSAAVPTLANSMPMLSEAPSLSCKTSPTTCDRSQAARPFSGLRALSRCTRTRTLAACAILAAVLVAEVASGQHNFPPNRMRYGRWKPLELRFTRWTCAACSWAGRPR